MPRKRNSNNSSKDGQETYRSGSLAELVGSVGPGAALILGLIYAVGALVKTAELRNAGVDVGTAFPLIPIQQHLSRGIEIFLAPSTLGWLVAFFVIGAIVHRLPLPRVSSKVGVTFDRGLRLSMSKSKSSEREPKRKPKTQALSGDDVRADTDVPVAAGHAAAVGADAVIDGRTAAGGGETATDGGTAGGQSAGARSDSPDSSDGSGTDGDAILSFGMVVIGVGVMFFSIHVQILLTIVVVLALGGGFLLLTHSFTLEQGRLIWFWPTSSLVVTLALMLGSIAVVNAFATSANLPVARLEMANGSTIDGQVIAATDQSWYLAVAGGHLKVIDADRVDSAVISKVKPTNKTVLQEGLFRLAFPTAYHQINIGSREAEHWFNHAVKSPERWLRRNRTLFNAILIVIFGLFLVSVRVRNRRTGSARPS